MPPHHKAKIQDKQIYNLLRKLTLFPQRIQNREFVKEQYDMYQ